MSVLPDPETTTNGAVNSELQSLMAEVQASTPHYNVVNGPLGIAMTASSLDKYPTSEGWEVLSDEQMTQFIQRAQAKFLADQAGANIVHGADPEVVAATNIDIGTFDPLERLALFAGIDKAGLIKALREALA